MHWFFDNPFRKWATALGFVFIVWGMIWTPILMSLGMFFMLGHVVLHPQWFQRIIDFFKVPKNWAWILLPLISACSIFWSDNVAYAQSRILSKLPLIVVPMSIGLMPWLPGKWAKYIWYTTAIIVLSGIFYSLFIYINNISAINQNYLKAGVLKTPCNHIRFSLIVCTVFTIAFFQLLFYKTTKKELYLIIGIAITCFIYLHILAVRSGLLTLYISTFIIGISYAWHKQKKHLILLLVPTVLLIAAITSFSIPTIRNKIKYTLWDLHLYKNQKEIASISDGQRIISWYAGWDLLKENFWFGVGAGDIKNDMYLKIKQKFPFWNEKKIDPHNQFLYSWVASGIFAFFALLWLLNYAFFKPVSSTHCYLLYAWLSIIFVSMIFEATLETQLGLTFFIYFYQLILAFTPHDNL